MLKKYIKCVVCTSHILRRTSHMYIQNSDVHLTRTCTCKSQTYISDVHTKLRRTSHTYMYETQTYMTCRPTCAPTYKQKTTPVCHVMILTMEHSNFSDKTLIEDSERQYGHSLHRIYSSKVGILHHFS